MASSRSWIEFALAVTVAVMMAPLGCGQAGPSAVEVVQAAERSADQLQTYEFDITIGGFLSRPETHIKGAIDTASKRMKQETTVGFAGSGESIRTESYVIDDARYWMEEAEEQQYWVRMTLSEDEDVWKTDNPADTMLSWLEQSLEWHTLGDEEVSGIDCYVVEAVHDSSLSLETLAMAETLEVDRITDIRLRFWLDKETYFVVQTSLSMGLESADSDFELTAAFYDHNKPINIELPPEADSATWVGAVTIPGFLESLTDNWDYEDEGRTPIIGMVGYADPDSADAYQALEEYCLQHHGLHLHGAEFPPAGTMTFADEIAKLRECDFIFLVMDGEPVDSFEEEAREGTYGGKLIGADASGYWRILAQETQVSIVGIDSGEETRLASEGLQESPSTDFAFIVDSDSQVRAGSKQGTIEIYFYDDESWKSALVRVYAQEGTVQDASTEFFFPEDSAANEVDTELEIVDDEHFRVSPVEGSFPPHAQIVLVLDFGGVHGHVSRVFTP